ncbi:MAG: glycoside hydrolase/phage tail family protein, partial [Methylocella sp.]
VLHYAKLCALAGGVDAFLIGSELRGLTSLRGTGNSFPFVSALVALAADVKAMLPGTKVSYAADWSEYFGYHPTDGTGDVFFNLDPLWSSPQVDFIGIDNYMPLTDWRDGHQHTDRLAGVTSIYDPEYLASGIAGGEGYDWYYASEAARQSQTRSAITDGAYGKPWIFRYKDLKSWWLNPHYDRPGGVEAVAATGWVPQSKPFWFTEAGSPAIDKGTNQPNAFVDAKSAESLVPYFSSGERDDLTQNRYVTALNTYWSAAGAHNPVSSLYGSAMVDAGRILFWAWDARPFPFFPARADLWSDAVNYARGHWLNGRIGAVPLARLIEAVCAQYGFADLDVSEVEGLVDGYLIDRPMSARDALEGVLAAFAIDAVERNGLIAFHMRQSDPVLSVGVDGFVETDAAQPLFALTRAQETELPAVVRLAYVE